ncbi:HK97-gp10 family putative phage morphogenesis protein [Pantoea endophytica]|uniref:HK97-gp10 family putative phage morphogenesis protein n=1 Tax=Pantoea endophytica TaxID=92488 RepID=UPI0024136AA6|nr:HK97-gp10 family putative phage morphogenesis protein [Pantoea endophytica]
MADSVEFSLIGMDDLIAKLDTVSNDLRMKGGRFALRKAGNVIVDKAKANARRIDDPHTGRSIADNIAMRWNGRLFRQTGNIAFRIGVLHGAVIKNHPDKAVNAPTPHWRLIEFGTEKMRAQPMLRPAAETSIDMVVSVFGDQYMKALDRAIARALRRGESP